MVRNGHLIAGVPHSLLHDELHGTVRDGTLHARDSAIREGVRGLRVQQGRVFREPSSDGLLFLHSEPRVRDGPPAPGLGVPCGVSPVAAHGRERDEDAVRGRAAVVQPALREGAAVPCVLLSSIVVL